MPADSIQNFLCSKLRRSFAVISLLLLLVFGVSAQSTSTDGTTPTGMAPGSPSGSYTLSGFESINYFNGSLNFSMPLMSVNGRGGAAASVMLNLEQHWRMEDVSDGNSNFSYAVPQWWNPDIPTFNPGTMTARHVGNGTQSCYPYCANDTGCTFGGTLTRLTFTAPDGTEHEFRDQLTNGKGIRPGCADIVGYNRGKVFVSTDSSSMVFISDQDIHDNLNYNFTEGVTGYLKMSDGSVYRFEGSLKSIRDRNGNIITFEYGGDYDPARYVDENHTYYTGVLSKITDSLNREVTFHYNVNDPQHGLCNQITFKGFGGTSRTISISYANLQNTLRADQTLKTYRQLFPGLNGNSFSGPNDPDSLFNARKAAAIYLPNGQSYQFQYTSYGELAQVTLPTGGWIAYDYDAGMQFIDTGYPHPYFGNDIDLYRRVVARRDSAGGMITISQPESVEVTYNGSGYGPQITRLDHVDVQQYDRGQPVALTKHYYYGNAIDSMIRGSDGLSYNPWKEGKEWKTEIYDGVTSNLLRRVEQHWEQRAHIEWWSGSPSAGFTADAEPANDPRVYETITTLADVSPNKIAKEVFTYDLDPNIKYNSLTDTYSYNYGSGSAGTQLLGHTHIDYLNYRTLNNGVDYSSNDIHLLNLPVKQSIFGLNSSGQEVEWARTTYEYDNYLPDSNNKHAVLINYSDISGLCTWYSASGQCTNLNPSDGSDPTGYKTRGNATVVSRWFLSNAGTTVGDPITSYVQYDVAGHAIKAIDPRGNVTRIYFDDNFGSPDDNEARSNTQPTQWLTTGHSYAFPTKVTNAIGFTSYNQFDYYSGKSVNVEDINGTVTSAYYDDPFDRNTQIVSAANSPTLRHRTTVIYNDTSRSVTAYGDQNNDQDRAFHQESYYDGFGRIYQKRIYDNASQPGQYILATMDYDSLGRVIQVSNPYRPSLGESAVNSTKEYDALNRVTKVTAPDSQPLVMDYTGNTITTTDPTGKKKTSSTDALGRLMQVIEDPDNYHFITNYTYDVFGNLRKVAQGSQERYFAYDSLGRLIRTKNPEQDVNSGLPSVTDPITGWSQWSTAYTYDANSNLETLTDPRGVVTTNAYDQLSRIKTITYTNDPTNTAPVTFNYDASDVANSKGRLTSVVSSVSTYNYTEYDSLGRIKSSSQITDGRPPYAMSYGYDRAGELTSETYPSGRIVTTNYDIAGRIVGLDGQKGNQTTPYLSAVKYWSFGALKEMQLGNGLNEHILFNNRLQPIAIALGTSNTDSSLLKLEYGYGEINGSGVLDTTRNNGNVQSQKITVPNIASPLTQTYTYDALNRLHDAQENGGTSWKQTFKYDRYGNRTIDIDNTTPDLVGDNPQISETTTTNRITPGQNEGYRYDLAGNLDRDKAGTPLTYDAGNRLTAFNGGATNAYGTSYFFDGLGQRIKKADYYSSTVFVYDAFGKMVAEYSSTGPTGTGGTSYITADTLGTPRVITGANGEVKSRHDYLPFGEEIGGAQVSFKGGRGASQMYMGDSLHQKFTGQERDAESGLDYFLARSYSSAQGRFTSPDPLLASANLRRPQTWNRYTYVLNNPLRYTDPSGLFITQDVKDEYEKKKDPHPDKNNLLVNEDGSLYKLPAVEVTVGGKSSRRTSSSSVGGGGVGRIIRTQFEGDEKEEPDALEREDKESEKFERYAEITGTDPVDNFLKEEAEASRAEFDAELEADVQKVFEEAAMEVLLNGNDAREMVEDAQARIASMEGTPGEKAEQLNLYLKQVQLRNTDRRWTYMRGNGTDGSFYFIGGARVETMPGRFQGNALVISPQGLLYKGVVPDNFTFTPQGTIPNYSTMRLIK